MLVSFVTCNDFLSIIENLRSVSHIFSHFFSELEYQKYYVIMEVIFLQVSEKKIINLYTNFG